MEATVTKEQRLVDLLFHCARTIHSDPWFKNRNAEEVSDWVSRQLEYNGFPATQSSDDEAEKTLASLDCIKVAAE